MSATAQPLAVNPVLHPVHGRDRWCLSRLGAFLAGAPVRVDLWNGMSAAFGTPIHAAVQIHDRQTLWRLLRQPAWAFGEAYAAGRLHGTRRSRPDARGVNRVLAGRPFERVHEHAGGSTSQSRHNVHVHYDLGNDFYRLWLDEQMVYSCAYFHRPGATLEAAQRAKLDYVCRKLGLAPGEAVMREAEACTGDEKASRRDARWMRDTLARISAPFGTAIDLEHSGALVVRSGAAPGSAATATASGLTGKS